MRVEAGGLPEVGSGGGKSAAAAKNPGLPRRRRLRQQQRRPAMPPSPVPAPAPTAVQRLFEACREVFGASDGAVPSPAGIERIKSVLENTSAADVSLTPNMPYFRRVNSHGTPKITYLHLYESEAFSIGIFCLPPRGVIPLHNHPNMTVFSKLLFGKMYVKSYDWAEASQDSTDVRLQGLRLAKVKVDGILNAPCETSVLYPEDGGNLHCFTAQTACAVLDVLGPPYDDGSGRHCQHYNVASSAPSAGDSRSFPRGDGYAWLEECERPANFHLVGSTYMGPRILDN
uniref:cysteine dioxygenase n=1 Tax=Leersia perrieri TaxID=77586 RepID=A0A0D9UXN4_9ORYZ